MSVGLMSNGSLSGRQIKLRNVGDIYMPGKFIDLLAGGAALRLFGPNELSQLNRIFNHLRRGGIAVISGRWDKILEMFSYLEKKKRELVTTDSESAVFQTEMGHHKLTRRWYERHYKEILARIMVIARDDKFPYIEPPIHIPYLPGFLGELPGSNSGLLFLVPVLEIQKIRTIIKQFYYVPALEGEIVAHSNVLSPLSQDTIELFLEGLQKVKQAADQPANMEILDMGCGCGVLSLLAAKVFADPKIIATDILPEAIATTKLNVQRFIEAAKLAPDVVETTDGGDLFDPVGDRRFDIIIFNVPWVVSHPRSRAEIAIYDKDQNTLRRFLVQSPQHLKETGRIVLGYSDHSGPKALENLEAFVREAGFNTESILKRRIQSRRERRRRETVMVYGLVLRG